MNLFIPSPGDPKLFSKKGRVRCSPNCGGNSFLASRCQRRFDRVWNPTEATKETLDSDRLRFLTATEELFGQHRQIAPSDSKIHRFLSEEAYWHLDIPKDVVEKSHRGRGLSKWLMECVMAHPASLPAMAVLIAQRPGRLSSEDGLHWSPDGNSFRNSCLHKTSVANSPSGGYL